MQNWQRTVTRRPLIWLRRSALVGLAVLTWTIIIGGSYSLGSDCRYGRTKIINATQFPLTNARFQFREEVLWSGRIEGYQIVEVSLDPILGALQFHGSIGDNGKPFSVTIYAMSDVDDVDVFLITEKQTLAWTIRTRRTESSPTALSTMKDISTFALGALSCIDRGLWRAFQSTFL